MEISAKDLLEVINRLPKSNSPELYHGLKYCVHVLLTPISVANRSPFPPKGNVETGELTFVWDMPKEDWILEL